MRPHGVVVTSPVFDDDLCLLERVEDFTVEQFVTELRIEALAIAVFPRTARHDVGGLGTHRRDPFPQCLGDELRPVVGPNMRRDAAQDEQVGKHVDDIDGLQLSLDPDGNAFARELVDHIEHADFPAIVCAILDEVVGPDMVWIFRPKPDTRAVVQPQPTAFGLPVRHLQPLPPPDAFDPLDVHDPASLVQHRSDATIAIAAILESERRDVGGQRCFVIRGLGDLALRRTMLTENPAGPSLGHAQFLDDMIHAGAAAGGA